MSAERVRVVYLVSTLRRAGPTSQLLNIVRHLDRRQFDPVVVTLSPEPPESMLDAFEKAGVVVKSLSMSRL
ncbi:MAG: glycosyltransferase, partial [Woeseiaceae bacterium]